MKEIIYQYKETGESFAEYRTRIRVEQAKKRLTTTDDALTSIAIDLGFSDQSHFSAVFKKHTGQSPRQFRIRARHSYDV